MRTAILLLSFLVLQFNPSYAWEEARIDSVADTELPFSNSFHTQMSLLEGKEIQVQILDEGISQNLILRKKGGSPFGIFRRAQSGGIAEAMVLYLDRENFFQFAPVVKLTLFLNGKLVDGYLQRFEKSNEDAPQPHLSLQEEIQRIGLLDLLLLNRDRHRGNFLLRDGTFVPIDHNLTLLNDHLDNAPELNLTERIEGEVFSFPILHRAIHKPFWWNRPELRQYIRRSWTPAARSWILEWDPQKFTKSLQEKFNLSSDSALLLKVMGLWVKMGVAANLNLEQLATPIYGPDTYYFTPPIESNVENFQSIWPMIHIDYLLRLVLHNTRNAVDQREIPPEELESTFFMHLKTAFENLIALLKETASVQEKQMQAEEAWMHYMRGDVYEEIFEPYTPSNRHKSQPSLADASQQLHAMHPKKQKSILDLAQDLTFQRYLTSYGSIEKALADYQDAYWIFYTYVESLIEAFNEGRMDEMQDLLRDQLQRPQQLLLPGVLWGSEMHMRMLNLPREKLIEKVRQTRERVRRDANYYVHPDREAWMRLVASKYFKRLFSETSHEIAH